MNQTDVYYRALLAYREEVSAHRACVKDTRLYAEAEGYGRITVKRTLCTVDEEWIRAIEEGLIHIEKAIKEERQFIYSNGEVVPIEKVKNISKDSVQHLARHSELITRAQEGEDIIPDSLYTVERLSDYAVYENRFLYMLLCYLRDFVTLRYQNILELTNRYEGVLSVEREIKSNNRQVRFSIDMDEIRRDDPYLREHNPVRSLIERMDLILKTILAFLATPLMESAGKVAMLKPPITKTNVLKMDNNFKGAVALYDYIIAYTGQGYTATEQETCLDPFRDALAEDMAEAERLMAFLTYRYGLDLEADLKGAYEVEEARRREEKLKERTEQMAAVRRRLAAEGQPVEAYILHLEKHARALQNEVDRVPGLMAEMEEHAANERQLTEEVETLTDRLEKNEIAHAEELQRTVATYEEQLASLKEAHAAEMQAMREEHASAMASMQETHAAELKAVKELHATELNAVREDYEKRMSVAYEAHVAERNEMKASLSVAEQALGEATQENLSLTEDQKRLRAQVIGLRAGKNAITAEEMDKMTSEESFDELERELEAFARFYEEQWTRTKRAIRKDLLNMKSIKRQIGKK